jgi:hypothetical protein
VSVAQGHLCSLFQPAWTEVTVTEPTRPKWEARAGETRSVSELSQFDAIKPNLETYA